MKTALLILVTPLLVLVLAHGYYAILERIDENGYEEDHRMWAWIVSIVTTVFLWWIYIM